MDFAQIVEQMQQNRTLENIDFLGKGKRFFAFFPVLRSYSFEESSFGTHRFEFLTQAKYLNIYKIVMFVWMYSLQATMISRALKSTEIYIKNLDIATLLKYVHQS